MEIDVPGIVTNILVKGSTKNNANKPVFSKTTGSHLRLIRKPTETTAMKSGKKSKNGVVTNTGVLPKPRAPKFPSNTVKPPK